MSDTPADRPVEPARPLYDVPGMHSVSFQKNSLNGRFRAMCTCGWARSGPASDEPAIRVAIATHDLEWVDALNVQNFPTAQ